MLRVIITAEFDISKEVSLKDVLDCVSDAVEDLRGWGAVSADINIPEQTIKL
jgi:hypothetical protein